MAEYKPGFEFQFVGRVRLAVTRHLFAMIVGLRYLATLNKLTRPITHYDELIMTFNLCKH
jgi:hypothetical protein